MPGLQQSRVRAKQTPRQTTFDVVALLTLMAAIDARKLADARPPPTPEVRRAAAVRVASLKASVPQPVLLDATLRGLGYDLIAPPPDEGDGGGGYDDDYGGGGGYFDDLEPVGAGAGRAPDRGAGAAEARREAVRRRYKAEQDSRKQASIAMTRSDRATTAHHVRLLCSQSAVCAACPPDAAAAQPLILCECKSSATDPELLCAHHDLERHRLRRCAGRSCLVRVQGADRPALRQLRANEFLPSPARPTAARAGGHGGMDVDEDDAADGPAEGVTPVTDTASPRGAGAGARAGPRAMDVDMAAAGEGADGAAGLPAEGVAPVAGTTGHRGAGAGARAGPGMMDVDTAAAGEGADGAAGLPAEGVAPVAGTTGPRGAGADARAGAGSGAQPAPRPVAVDESAIRHVVLALPLVPAHLCTECGSAGVRPSVKARGVARVWGLSEVYEVGETSLSCATCSAPHVDAILASSVLPISATHTRAYIERKLADVLCTRFQASFKAVPAEEQARFLESTCGAAPDLAAFRAFLQRLYEEAYIVLPALRGTDTPCLACAEECPRVWGDGNMKAYSYEANKGSDLDRNMGRADVVRTGADMAAQHEAFDSSAALVTGNAAANKCGDTAWTAAKVEALEGKEKAITGIFSLTCAHRSNIASLPMSTAESSRYHILALLLSLRLKAKVFYLDCACQFLRTLKARTAVDIGCMDAVARVLVAGTSTIRFFFDRALPGEVRVEVTSATEATAPSPLPPTWTLVLTIPTAHACAHSGPCRDTYGARSTPLAGWGNETAEHMNAALSANVSNARMMGPASWHDHFAFTIAAYNQNLAAKLPATLLRAFSVALDNLIDAHRALAAARAGHELWTDGALQARMEERRAQAAQEHETPRRDITRDKHRRYVQMMALGARASALDAAAKTAAGNLPALLMAIEASTDAREAVGSRQIRSVEEVNNLVASLRHKAARMGEEVMTNDDFFKERVVELRRVVTTLTALKGELEHGRKQRGTLNADGIAKQMAKQYEAAGRILTDLRAVQPLVEVPEAKEWPIPEAREIGPGFKLPTYLGVMEFEQDASKEDNDAVDAFTTLRRAQEEFDYARGDIPRAATYARKVLGDLERRIRAALAAAPDLAAAAGSSPFHSGYRDSHWADASAETGVPRDVADALARRMYAGRGTLRRLVDQLDRLEAGVLRVQVGADDGRLPAPLPADTMGRNIIQHHGHALLSGKITPADWASLRYLTYGQMKAAQGAPAEDVDGAGDDDDADSELDEDVAAHEAADVLAELAREGRVDEDNVQVGDEDEDEVPEDDVGGADVPMPDVGEAAEGDGDGPPLAPPPGHAAEADEDI